VKSLTIRNCELSYADHGAGVPVLLVHGFPLDHTMWMGQIGGLTGQAGDLLVGESFMPPRAPNKLSAPPIRLIAPDLRGFGRSRPEKADETVTMDEFADDLASLLDGLSVREPVVFCGLSMGGYIAFQFWRKYAARLRGLILCDTRAAADTPDGAAGRRDMADRVLREGPAPLVDTMLPKLLAEATQRQRPTVVDGLRSVMMANDPHGIAAAARGMAERPDMTGTLGQIGCPTLVLVGQNDAISTPTEMRGLAQAIPGAKFVEIPAAGHLSPLENPAAVNAAIGAFLRQLG
jgi:3-oxoadipate enol-lactonase